MKILLLFIAFFYINDPDQKQWIGNTVTYELYCPCKLFKYYEDGQILYFCNDEKNNIEYFIKEFKHLDGIDILIKNIKKTISEDVKNKLHTALEENKKQALENYLKTNTDGQYVNIIGEEAIIVNRVNEKKLFFSDKNFIVSYELIILGENNKLLNKYFNNTVESLRIKAPKL